MPQQNDLSRSLIPFEHTTTLVAVIELSLSSWLIAGTIPGIERQPLKKIVPDETELLRVLQPDRDLVLDPGPQTPPPWQLHIQGASPAEDRELHRLLQCHDGEAVSLDDEGQAAGGVRCPKGFGLPTRCTRPCRRIGVAYQDHLRCRRIAPYAECPGEADHASLRERQQSERN
jgi:hypothetical protein